MKNDSTAFVSIASWAVLAGSLLTVGVLALANVWLASQSVLVLETATPGWQGLSLPARYLLILRAGFVNVPWLLAFAGVLAIWFLTRSRGAPARRMALALSLIFVHRWLQLTFVFQVLSSRWDK